MEKTLFEQMGGTYKQVGDYLLPDVELPEEKPVGVWGTRHYHHLRKANRILFSQLAIGGKMNDYLADIDKQAEKMFSQLVKQLHLPELRRAGKSVDLPLLRIRMITRFDFWSNRVIFVFFILSFLLSY